MQVIVDPQVIASFFLIGLRAPVGGQGPDAEKVGVIVIKQTVQIDGTVDNKYAVLAADAPYPPGTSLEPVRIEAELATTKPNLDVVAVHEASYVGVLFGELRINRVSGAGVVINPFNFGWQARTESPRLDLAGPEADLLAFVPEGDNLPGGFRNAFFNGSFIAGQAHLVAGDELVFEEGAFVGATGATYSLIVPTPPALSITRDGQPVSPPVAIDYSVDTVVFDWTSKEFLVNWRGVFLWDDRLQLANLEVI